MRIGGLAPPLFAPGVGPGASSTLSPFQRLSQYRLGNQRLLDLRRDVLDVQRLVGKNPLALGAPGSTVSLTGSDLRITSGLDLTGTSSTLTSTEQVNAATTSISHRTPDWVGGSTAPITLDGTYTGGTDATVWFTTKMNQADSPATIPASAGVSVIIEMRDATGVLDSVEVGNGAPAGTTFTFTNGVTLSLGEGSVVRKDDSFTVDLFATTGSALDRTKPFNGTGDQDAILQDPHAITTGAFTINGTSIAVNASDSLDDLLARINASGAGVTAAYDDATEQVTLTADAAGSGTITLADDTSGALAALKLDGAATTTGTDPDDQRAMSQVAGLSTVVAGNITVNGQLVAVDPSSDSLQDVLARINALEGVSASFTDGKVTIIGELGQDLTLADSSGLLARAGVATGQHEAVGGEEAGMSTDLSRRVAKALRKLANTVDAFLADQYAGPRVASGIERLRASLGTEFKSVFEADGDAFAALGGMRFEFSDGQSRGVTATLGNERKLARLLDEGDKDTLTALLGDGDDEPGLLERLEVYTRKNLAGIQESLGVGSSFDARL